MAEARDLLALQRRMLEARDEHELTEIVLEEAERLGLDVEVTRRSLEALNATMSLADASSDQLELLLAELRRLRDETEGTDG